MKVKELIETLQGLDAEAEVILSRDAAGNGHSPCYNVWDGVYVPESTWAGEVYEEQEWKDCREDYGPDDKAIAAVVLNPTH